MFKNAIVPLHMLICNSFPEICESRSVDIYADDVILESPDSVSTEPIDNVATPGRTWTTVPYRDNRIPSWLMQFKTAGPVMVDEITFRVKGPVKEARIEIGEGNAQETFVRPFPVYRQESPVENEKQLAMFFFHFMPTDQGDSDIWWKIQESECEDPRKD